MTTYISNHLLDIVIGVPLVAFVVYWVLVLPGKTFINEIHLNDEFNTSYVRRGRLIELEQAKETHKDGIVKR